MTNDNCFLGKCPTISAVEFQESQSKPLISKRSLCASPLPSALINTLSFPPIILYVNTTPFSFQQTKFRRFQGKNEHRRFQVPTSLPASHFLWKVSVRSSLWFECVLLFFFKTHQFFISFATFMETGLEKGVTNCSFRLHISLFSFLLGEHPCFRAILWV